MLPGRVAYRQLELHEDAFFDTNMPKRMCKSTNCLVMTANDENEHKRMSLIIQIFVTGFIGSLPGPMLRHSDRSHALPWKPVSSTSVMTQPGLRRLPGPERLTDFTSQYI